MVDFVIEDSTDLTRWLNYKALIAGLELDLKLFEAHLLMKSWKDTSSAPH